MSNAWLEGRLEKAFPIYKTFHAMNLHFHGSSKYDYFKYSGETNLKFDSFCKGTNAKPAMRLIDQVKDLDIEKVFFAVLRDEKVWFGTPFPRMKVKYVAWREAYSKDPKTPCTATVLHDFLSQKITIDEAAIQLLHKPDTLTLSPSNMFEEGALDMIMKVVPFYKKFYGE